MLNLILNKKHFQVQGFSVLMTCRFTWLTKLMNSIHARKVMNGYQQHIKKINSITEIEHIVTC